MIHVEGTIQPRQIAYNAETVDPAEAVRRFIRVYPDGRIEKVNGKFVRGICACGAPVFQDDLGYDFDQLTGWFVCPNCVTERRSRQ